ncbi:hypothetical protein N5F23_26500 [Pseudomonas sichuanensis]|uniref:zonular occludens toxin domain-containing protein n=1 Tax=Pseudomonas sichuanensis TaxID=2213015 RepID=UPI0024499FD0|nr:zonular occludens toxin domain-containing protein [Pseudomonas sichuanensis]MDH0734125.1 hypothetical protein [Pseudomonas sichuanensis]MDH1586153.1 hypothetical protein [Pseudomonas sichuanensis]MDH1595833.1 hypothetical protein [Pseudomonas sichuanensis]MDH1601074.1 hypothetical protein [Pseudomonas sichuanensis]
MAIHAYVGKPGAGKSYGVVEHVVIPSLKQDRHVFTNIPLVADDLLAAFGGNITQLPDDWHNLEDLGEIIPPGAVAIIDECWIRWPSGESINRARQTDKSLLAEHRHRVDIKNNSMRVVLVTQDLKQISSWVRDLVETTFRVRKLSKKVYKVDIYQGAVTGDSPPKSKLVRTDAGIFKASVYTFYKSATQSASGSVGDESAADGRSSIFRSFGLWSCLVAFLIFIVLGSYGVKSFFSSNSDHPSPTKPALHQVKQKPIEHPLSTTWRLVGFVHPSKPDPNSRSVAEPLALISDSSGNTRYISFNHCRYTDDFTEAFCIVDGSKITSWSLKKPLPVIGGLIGGGG